MLSTTELGRDVIEGTASATVAMPDGGAPAASSVKRGATKPASARSADAGEPRNEDLFEQLRAWRFKRARKSRIPAYMIFNDATLDELARVRPSTQDELLQIKGIGPAKARKLGKEVLAMIAESGGPSAAEAPAREPEAAAPEFFREPVPSEEDIYFVADAEEEFNG